MQSLDYERKTSRPQTSISGGALTVVMSLILIGVVLLLVALFIDGLSENRATLKMF